MSESQPDIIGVCEVKPKNYRKDLQLSEFNIEGYDMLPLNLEKGPGRGMLLYIKDTIRYSPFEIQDNKFNESILCEIRLVDNDKLLVGCIYRSPNSTDDNNDSLNELMRSIVQTRSSHVVLFGDFNYPDIDWKRECTPKGEDNCQFKFLEASRDCFLHQHITEATRGRGADTPSVIDLIFSSEEGMVSDIDIKAPLGKSDHAVISFALNTRGETVTTNRLKYKYDKADYDKMRELLTRDWESDFKEYGDDVDSIWEKFKTILNEVVDACVPHRYDRSQRKKNRHPVPMNRKALCKIKRKQRLWSRYLKSRDEQDYTEYCKARNQVKTITRNITKQYEKNIASQVKTNPQKFWQYAQSKTKVKSTIPDLYKKQDSKECTETDKEKAEVLADFFTSVFTTELDNDMPPIEVKPVPELKELTVTRKEVTTLLSKLKIAKSPGPDNIHPRILKEMCEVISEPLTIIFQKSVGTGVLPEDWKSANITAIYKKGGKKVAGNYRPISLTSIVCKLLESIIRGKLILHMKKFKLFSPKQFGFISGRSTVLQLLQVIDIWLEILDSGGCVDAIYCDFMKAFDKVPHLRLLHKLQIYNIGEKYINWMRSFLLGRKQRVVVNGETSEWKNVISGIPQGSVLGPLLFVLYINDLPDVTDDGTSAFLYADDTKAFREILTKHDCQTLQTDIYKMQEWADTWLLCFHPDKCKIMRIGKSDLEKPTYRLRPNSEPLEITTHEKDIGVIIDDRLSFEQHMTEKVKKANSIMGVIRRTMEFLDLKSFKLLYTALVRPHLEYANQVWSPHLKKHIHTIENVQRRATKQISGISNLRYEERLETLKLPTLAYRRIRGDMVEMYKILSGKYDHEVSNFIKLRGDKKTRGHNLTIYKQHARLNIRKNSFVYRSVDVWNNLPVAVITAPTLMTFEKRLDKLWKDQPILYDCDAKIHHAHSVATSLSDDDLELTVEAQ